MEISQEMSVKAVVVRFYGGLDDECPSIILALSP